LIDATAAMRQLIFSPSPLVIAVVAATPADTPFHNSRFLIRLAGWLISLPLLLRHDGHFAISFIDIDIIAGFIHIATVSAFATCHEGWYYWCHCWPWFRHYCRFRYAIGHSYDFFSPPLIFAIAITSCRWLMPSAILITVTLILLRLHDDVAASHWCHWYAARYDGHW